MEILKHEGKPAFVVIPYAEFLSLQEKLEDLDDAQAYREAKAALASGEDELVPASVVDRLLNENPVRVWREYRGLKQNDLATRVGITASLLSQIENGSKQGSLETLKKLAQALKVDLDDLV